MKTRQLWRLTILLTLWAAATSGFAQVSAFTYQGRLNLGGAPANGLYDFNFRLLNDPSNGVAASVIPINLAVPVTNGIFTTGLDFGAENFDGANLWLEINVRTNGGGAFTTLAPRQLLTSTPYAVRALSASNLLGTLPASQISGVIPNASLPASPSFAGTVGANSFSGNGANMSNVNAATLGGLSSSNFWQLGGNAGTTSNNFLGTTDDQALELRVNGNRALQIKPTANGVPNLIGGSSNNYAGQGIENLVGVTIGGGDSNGVTAASDYSTIAGGLGNRVVFGNPQYDPSSNSLFATIGGGRHNTIMGENSTIAGGQSNVAHGSNATIGGGLSNSISAAPNSGSSHTIAGGSSNSIKSSLPTHVGYTIGGGIQNSINANSAFSAISGGGLNKIIADSRGSTIGGGYSNRLDIQYGTIAGGRYNSIDAYGFSYSVIGGGNQNLIRAEAATIAGGYKNTIVGIGGGSIGGGAYNYLNDSVPYPMSFSGKTISGGYSNRIDGGGAGATGGSTISGGISNLVTSGGRHAFIPGGSQAKASNHGQMAHAGGHFQSIGDAQTSVYICRVITTNATPQDLFLDGVAKFINIPTNSTWALDLLVTARAATGSSAVYQIRGSVRNDAGVTALFGVPAVTIIGEDNPAWDVAVSANDTNDSLVVAATGEPGQTVRWVATVRSVEVSY